jgi:DNA-binding LacI/PurR family transcriptional regulator
VAFNDLVALGALRQLKRLGLRVPEDIALVGCDDQFFAPYTDPPLTTLDLHIGRPAGWR